MVFQKKQCTEKPKICTIAPWGKEMLREIVSAYRMDDVCTEKKMEETSAHYTLRWCLSGKIGVALEDDAFLLCAGQVLILPPLAKIGLKFSGEDSVRYAVTSFILDDGDADDYSDEEL